jgi:hypothetical protein
MSATLFALVALQGSVPSFSPGYPSLQECQAVYQGPYVTCFPYDPDGRTWTAFFRIQDGTVRAVTRIPNEAECQRIVGNMRDDTPRACRQLDQPYHCTSLCRVEIAPMQPPAPTGTIPSPPAPPMPPAPKSDQLPSDTKPDPLSYNEIQERNGKSYTRLVTTAEKHDSFADVSVGPSRLQPADIPTIAPLPPKRRVIVQQRRQQFAYAKQFDPIGAIVSLVTAPFATSDW